MNTRCEELVKVTVPPEPPKLLARLQESSGSRTVLEVQAIGAAAVNQAVKSIAISRLFKMSAMFMMLGMKDQIKFMRALDQSGG